MAFRVHPDPITQAQVLAELARDEARAARDQAEGHAQDAEGHATAAEGFAVAAQESAVAAATSEAVAVSQASLAEGFASSAASSAGDAASARDAAQAAQGAAEFAQGLAEGFAAAAVAARDKAQDWADTDEDVPVEEDPDRFSAKHWAIKAEAIAAAGGGVRPAQVIGLQGKAEAGTTEITLDAVAIVLRDADGQAITVNDPGVPLTCDFSTQGAGGRDHANPYEDQWVYVYYIYNPDTSTIALLASSTYSPWEGVTMPSGFTHWAFATALHVGKDEDNEVSYNLGFTGSKVFYDNGASEPPLVTAATDTTEQEVSAAHYVPPPALAFAIDVIVAAGGGQRQILIKYISGRNFAAPFTTGSISIPYWVPNIQQRFFWNWNGVAGDAAYVTIMGYQIPNGGE